MNVLNCCIKLMGKSFKLKNKENTLPDKQLKHEDALFTITKPISLTNKSSQNTNFLNEPP